MRTSLGRHGRQNLPVTRVNDVKQVETATSLQQTCRDWLIMWSPWRRTFTGFACFTATPIIIDEADVAVFRARIKQVELACASGQVVRG